MAPGSTTTLRNAVTALMLLILLFAGLEVWLRGRILAPLNVVAHRVSANDQSLLVSSSVCHHELRRLMRTSHKGSGKGTPISFRVNAIGCRGEEVDVVAAPGVYRILLLGDDSVCGSLVPEEETIGARLRRFLSKVTTQEIELINGGVPGYCPLLSALKFDGELAKLRPDLVILHVDMTDVADDMSYRSLMIKDGDIARCSHPALQPQPKSENALFRFVKQSATASWVVAKTREHGPQVLAVTSSSGFSDPGMKWITDDPPDLRIQIRHAFKPIADLQHSVRQAGGRLLVTTSPLLWQVASGGGSPELTRRLGVSGVTPFKSRLPFELLARFCEEARIHFCDTSSAFEIENATRLFSNEAPVLSRIGMTLYAREIARCLTADPPSQWSE